MPGPPPKPARLKILNGNPGKRKLPRSPTPPPGAPRRPPGMPSEAKTLWAQLVKQLGEVQLLTQLDSPALELLCRTWAEFRRASRVVEKDGQTYETGEGEKKMRRVRPEVAIAADAARRFRQLCQEFGLTPSARGRIDLDQLWANGGAGGAQTKTGSRFARKRG